MGVICTLRAVDEQLFRANRPGLRELMLGDPPDVIDVDKAWDGILWLISEERRDRQHMLPDPELPETWSLMPPEHDGEGEDQVGYLWPEQVKEVASRLAAIDEAALRAHFDPDRMSEQDVYPSIWGEEETALEYLAEHFDALRRFYLEAAERGRHMLVRIG